TGDIDDLYLNPPLAGVEPVRAQRPCGEVYESPLMGRLEFSRMPYGRPSFWRGEMWMPDSRYPLQIVCEVEGDDVPGSDHVACVTAFRRLQLQDAMVSAPLISERLRELKIPRSLATDDLVLTLIHLPPRPLTAARFELGFRAPALPKLSFTVVFVRGTPRSVRVDSDA
ncbi:MAG TPA: hypothetical protein VGM15_02375, partial [Burkholderiaceae bacterium]